MAYGRIQIFASDLFTWQEVRLQSAHPAWSDPYLVEGPRLLLPLTSCFSCKVRSGRFVCDPTTALWLSPAEPYQLRRPWPGQRSVLLGVLPDVHENFGPSRRAAVPLSTHVQLFRWAGQLAAREADPLAIDEGLATLVQSVQADPGGRTDRPNPAVERAREYLACEPERADSLASIARAASCSPFHLARQFRHHTGHSLHAFRTRLRMTRALDRVQQGERNLSALAMDLGYSSHSHFTAVFRKTFGVAPGALRAGAAPVERRRKVARTSTISTAPGAT